MQNPFKEFLYFSRGERRGILVLITGIILVFLSGYIYIYQREHRPLSDEAIRRQATAMAEYEVDKNLLKSAKLYQSVVLTEKWDNRLNSSSQKQPTTVSLVRFNPNTADSVTFCRLGLPGWMARNILRYRSKGGKFREAEDFRKIYGMTEKQYQALLPYIHITPEDTETRTVQLYSSPASNDSTATSRIAPEKYPAGILVDLNRADTTELKKIPGIGSGIARLIIGYRQRLGGFYNITQLQEIHLDTSQLQSWFSIDTRAIRLINLNRSSIERLRHHPYINFYQAKAFVEYRKKKGDLHSLKPFALYEEFSDTDLEKISHYVCFE